MLNLRASKPRVKGGPGPRGPPLDLHLEDKEPREREFEQNHINKIKITYIIRFESNRIIKRSYSIHSFLVLFLIFP